MVSKRAKKAFKKVMESNGKSVSKAMSESGFSPGYSKNPQLLTRSKTWQALLDEFLPEEDLGRHHRELMNARTIKTMLLPAKSLNADIYKNFKKLGFEVLTIAFLKVEIKKLIYFAMPDFRSRKEALDMAYKLRGRYAKTEHKLEFADTSDEELEAFIAGEISTLIEGDE